MEKLERKELQKDEGNQLELIKALESLRRRVEDYDEGAGVFGPRKRTPKGMYIFGGVGTGKTMCMNLFVDSLAPWVRKRRLHFHDMMRELHQRMHAKRTENSNKKMGGHEAILEIGREIAEESVLVALDEFFISDAADAVLVSQVLAASFRHGLVLVTTSNTAPGQLFPNDVDFNRRFVEGVLKTHCKFVNMSGTVDYREMMTGGEEGEDVVNNTKKRNTCKLLVVEGDVGYDALRSTEERLREAVRRVDPRERLPLELAPSVPFALDFSRSVRVPWSWRRERDGRLCMACTFDWLCGRGASEATFGVNDYAAFCRG